MMCYFHAIDPPTQIHVNAVMSARLEVTVKSVSVTAYDTKDPTP